MALVTNTTKSLSNMRDALQFLVREEIDGVNGVTSGGLFTSAEADRAINAGLHATYDITNTEPEIIWTDTVSGTREYNIPEARMVDGRAVVDRVFIEESDGTVTEIYGIEWDYDDEDTEAGTPESFYITGTDIGLEPTPDDVYTLTIVYRKDFVPLSADDDTTNLNDIDIDAALFYAASILKMIDEEYDASAAFKAQFEEIVGRSTTIKPGHYRDGSSYGEYGGAA